VQKNIVSYTKKNMGCHTWFYKKAESPSNDEMRSVIKDRCEKEIDFLNRLIHHRNEINQDLLEAYPEWTSEWAADLIPKWEKLLSFANGCDIDLSEFPAYFFEDDYSKDVLIEELYASWTGQVYVSGRGFFKEADYHDVFRKYGYPDDRLFSLEETLAYIDDPEKACSVHDREWTLITLNEFWEKYPDGMICFG